MKTRTIVLSSLALFLVSCAGPGKLARQRAECPERIALAIEKYEAGNYGRSKTILDEAKLQCAGLPVMDTAAYYLAMSLMRMKLYSEARVEFSRLVQEYPRSPYRDEAVFRIALSVLKSSRSSDRDQSETRQAVRLFRDFLESYPESPYADSAQHYMVEAVDKLAEKEFGSARFYQKLGEKEAAIVYYRSFIKEYPGSKFTARARLNLGQLLMELGRTAEAREVLDELIEREPEGETVRKARELLKQLGTPD